MMSLRGRRCFAGFAIALCSGLWASSAHALDDFGRLADFHLTQQDNSPFDASDLDGGIWVADFIFTRCQGQCPMMSRQMLSVQDAFHDEPNVRFLSLSVDPSFDTPEVLRAYAQTLGAGPNWVFANGSLEAIRTLAVESFKLGFGEGGPEDEPILHSSRFILIDAQRHVRGYYSAFDPEAQAQLIQDIRQLLDAQR